MGLRRFQAAPVPGKSKGLFWIASRALSVNAALQRKVISRLNGGNMKFLLLLIVLLFSSMEIHSKTSWENCEVLGGCEVF